MGCPIGGFNMTAVTDQLKIIQQESVDARSAVSEGVATDIAANQNFIFNRVFPAHIWRYNGLTGKFTSNIGADGPMLFYYDWEIAGFAYSINTVGSASSTIFDLRRYTMAGADQGSIWSTKPAVDSTAANFSATLYNQITSTTISNPTGHTLGVLSTPQIDADEQLIPIVDQGMTGGLDFFFWLFYRARNP